MLGLPDTGGLFDNFEVNREPFWPKVGFLIATSAAWHVLLITCIAIIPPVRDALNIAVLFSGAGFVDRPYTKTQIENEGDIVDLVNEKFHYPEGYFAMDQQGMPSPTPTPRMPAVFTPQPVSAAQLLAPSPTVMPSPIASPSPLIAANASPSPLSAEDEKAKQKIEQELDKLAADNGVKRPREINTRPFKDLLADAKKKKDQKELDLDGQIEITVEADRSDDGKLHNAKVSDKRGDKKLEAVALDFVSALSDSNVLDFLEGTRHLTLTAKLDDKNVEITVATEVESEVRARQMERAYNGMIVLGRIVKRGQDEEQYYNHTEVNSHEKEVSVKFSMSRDQMSQMLSKYTTEAK
jgi:hypothetical protein